jgi:predicted permease
MELNPLSHNFLAIAHTKAEVIAFSLKFIMTAASVVLYHLKWLSVVLSASSLLLLWIYLQWVRGGQGHAARV